MQQFIKQREVLTAGYVCFSPPIDVGGMPLLVTELIVYSITGTSPVLATQLQSCGDLESWQDAPGADTSLAAVGSDLDATRADTVPYGQYIRYKISLTGTTPMCEYSLILNTYQSS